MKRHHFIAVGGAIMHQLAIHLKNEGNIVTGSDDAIFDPAKSNLQKIGILPNELGWFPDNLTNNIDAIIVGMHAKSDNPELIKAQELGLKIYSFPEFIFEQSKNKKRIAIAGSHGKTSITSMIMHVLKTNAINFDYLVGAKIDGFNFMVKTSNDAEIMVIEADEYLTSPLDLRSKFLHYFPQIAVISGIAWDHINVFPTFDSYLETFRLFIKSIDKNGHLIYNNEDTELDNLVEKLDFNCSKISYQSFDFVTENEISYLIYNNNKYECNVFGTHNFANLKAAFEVCKLLNIEEENIIKALQTFNGAAKRLEKIYDDTKNKITIFRDFAHAPSKLKATVKAVREKYETRKIIAVFELHTYSSLQENFIEQYAHSLDFADDKILFLDNEALKIKNKQDLDSNWLKNQFADDSIVVYKTTAELKYFITQNIKNNCVVLMMSSGNFAGFDVLDVVK